MRFRRSWVAALMALLVSSSFMPPSFGSIVANAQQAESTGGLPGEISVDGERYTFDRDVTVDVSQLEQRSDDTGATVYVRPEGDLLAAFYVPSTTVDGNAGRYLPQYLNAPDTTCPSEALNVGTIQGDGGIFVAAGLENDLTPDTLVEIGSTDDGRSIYAVSAEQPFNELFATGLDEGLVRYLLVPESGTPTTLPQTFTFAGQQFQLASEQGVPGEELAKVGCAGQLPALTSAGETVPPFGNVYLRVGDRPVQYVAVDAPVGTPAPALATPTGTPLAPGTPEATIVASPSETLVPIGPTDPEETQVPPTPEPPTVIPAPTSTMAPTSTAAPTGTPGPTSTLAPAETVAPAETPVPTSTSTIVPTQSALATDTPQPTTPPEATVVATETPPDATETVVSRPTPTPRQLQPQAVAPTLPADAPPPAVATAPATRCAGNVGAVGDDGIPELLPLSLQYGGTGYQFTSVVSPEDSGTLTLLGCVGAFEASRGDQEDSTRILYLVLPNLDGSVFRYEATASFTVDFEVTNDPRVLTLPGVGDQPDSQYIANDPWQRSVYSSVTLLLYVADSEVVSPDRIFGVAVDADVIGEYVPEEEGIAASEDVLAAAAKSGILPELRLGTSNERYVLASLWLPFGTTTNGWLTLYGPEGEDGPALLLGVDPRRLDLLVFDRGE